MWKTLLNQDEPATEKEPEKQEPLSTLLETGQMSLPEIKSDIHVINVIGQIEGHLIMPPQNKTTRYEHIIPQLVAVEQAPEIKGVLLILNTVGGDVEAGLAIAEMVGTCSKPTVSLVLGAGIASAYRLRYLPIFPLSPPRRR